MSWVFVTARRISAQAFLRYVIVGTMLFAIDFGLFLILVRLVSLDLRVAQAISRTAGAALGFFAHRYVSFRSTGNRALFHWTGQGAGYFATVVLLNLVASPLVVWGVYRAVGARLILAKVTTDVILVLLSYFLLRIVFSARSMDDAPSPR